MKKVFISQPMKDLTLEQINAARAEALEMALELCGEIEVIDSFFTDDIEVKNEPLYNLGRSLMLMAEADVVIFCPGWDKARGCRIEHDAALRYGIGMIVDKW